MAPRMVQFFDSDGLRLAFIDVAPHGRDRGEPILLIHGFASNHRVNWVNPRWVETLTHDGRRVIAFDNRGHGQSDKPTDPAAYHSALMAADAARLLDHLGIERADVMGYSMGARIAAFLALADPRRVRRLVLGGLGDRLVEGVGLPLGIADAMEAPSLEALTDPMQRMFRAFAEQTKSDRVALAACIRGSRQTLSEAEAATHRLSDAGGGRRARRGRRRSASAGGDAAARKRARNSRPRPQSRRRRQGPQGRRAGIPRADRRKRRLIGARGSGETKGAPINRHALRSCVRPRAAKSSGARLLDQLSSRACVGSRNRRTES